MATLYEIGAEMRALEDFLTDIGGDVTDEAMDQYVTSWLVKNEKDLADKLDGYGMVIRNNEALSKARREESDRLLALSGTNDNVVKRLKKRLCEFMREHKIDKVNSEKFKWWVQKNGQRSMEIHDGVDVSTYLGQAGVPERYQKKIVTLDTAQLKEDLLELEGLLNKHDAWMESRAAGEYIRGRDECTPAELLTEFTIEDKNRVNKLMDLTKDLAHLAPIGYHVRLK